MTADEPLLSPIDTVRLNVEHGRRMLQRIDQQREIQADLLRRWEAALADMEATA